MESFKIKNHKDTFDSTCNIFDRVFSEGDKIWTYYCSQIVDFSGTEFSRTIILEAKSDNQLKTGKFTIFEQSNEFSMVDYRYDDFSLNKRVIKKP